jgi:hypothetical protein
MSTPMRRTRSPCCARLEAIDEIDHVVEPAAGAGSNAAASDGDRKMGFIGSNSQMSF